MKRLQLWLETEWSFSKALYANFVMMVGVWAYSIVGLIVIYNFFPQALEPSEASPSQQYEAEYGLFYGTLVIMVVCVIEEFIFRYMPLMIAIEQEFPFYLTMAVAISSSLLFGWVHGGSLFILFQGVHGFLWALLFLKAGGMQSRFGKGFAVVAIAHMSNNLLVSILVIILKSLNSP